MYITDEAKAIEKAEKVCLVGITFCLREVQPENECRRYEQTGEVVLFWSDGAFDSCAEPVYKSLSLWIAQKGITLSLDL